MRIFFSYVWCHSWVCSRLIEKPPSIFFVCYEKESPSLFLFWVRMKSSRGKNTRFWILFGKKGRSLRESERNVWWEYLGNGTHKTLWGFISHEMMGYTVRTEVQMDRDVEILKIICAKSLLSIYPDSLTSGIDLYYRFRWCLLLVLLNFFVK